ncbi:MAG: glycosyltransferase family 39 protein [Gemmatimonadetes bacterium]|nr:glycosyltransferase family 39 protein [Gemmatimonadota bacterium]
MSRASVWAGASAAVALALALALFDPRLFTGGDNATYYALAEALVTGRGYVDLITPGQPLHAVYPPGFPLLLVPFYWTFSGSMVGLKLVSLLAAGVALWGLWRLARRDPALPEWSTAAAVALVGLYPVFLDYAHWVLSEMAYLSVTLLATWVFLRAEPTEGTARHADRWTGSWLLGLALALVSFSIRTAGFALLLAALAHATLHRRWRRAAAAGGAVLAGAVPWLAWTTAHAPATGGYLQQLRASDPYDPLSPPLSPAGFVARSWDHAVHYATVELPRLFWPVKETPDLVVVAALLLGGGLLAWGVGRAVSTRGIEVWDLHALATAAVLVVWPWTGDRFFLTLAPFLWLYLLAGLDGASRLWGRSPMPAAVLAGALAAFLAIGAAARIPGQWEVTRAHMEGEELAGYNVFWSDYFEASRWIGEQAPDAVIVARKPSLAWYWSGRPAFVFPFRFQPEPTWRLIRARGATHALYDNLGSTQAFLRPALETRPDAIEVVHAAPARNVFVLRIAPPAETPGSP